MTGAWTVVLAAGSGSRFGARKQYADVAGRRAVDRVVTSARAVTHGVVVVVPPGDRWSGPAVDAVVPGGASRAESVRAGLAAVPPTAGVVVVHDAAHPLAPPALFRAVVAAVRGGADAAVPVLPVVEALKRVDGARVVASLDKAGVVLAQTPQAFRADLLRDLHAAEPETVEDIELVVDAGGVVTWVAGDPANLHVTTPRDLALADLLARAADGSGPAGP